MCVGARLILESLHSCRLARLIWPWAYSPTRYVVVRHVHFVVPSRDPVRSSSHPASGVAVRPGDLVGSNCHPGSYVVVRHVLLVVPSQDPVRSMCHPVSYVVVVRPVHPPARLRDPVGSGCHAASGVVVLMLASCAL